MSYHGVNRTILLLRTVGSPFSQKKYEPKSYQQLRRLYSHAVKNRIKMLFLETLRSQGSFGFFDREYELESDKYRDFLLTIVRVSEILEDANIDYAIIKTLMPYHMVPNDTDVILFGPSEDYFKAVNVLSHNGFQKWGEAALETYLHDTRNGRHTTGPKKDPFDVDIYKELGNSYLICFDKSRFKRYQTSTELLGYDIKLLAPEAEIPIIMFHSFFPEMIYTLAQYYLLLYHLFNMTTSQLKCLLTEIHRNRIMLAAKIFLGHSAKLHRDAHGTVPRPLRYILKALELDIDEFSTEMPIKYSMSSVIGVLMEKLPEKSFIKSLPHQIYGFFSMKTLKTLIQDFVKIRRRETY